MNLTTLTRRALLRTALATTALAAPSVYVAYAAGNAAASGNMVFAQPISTTPGWLNPQQHYGGITPDNFLPDNFLNEMLDALIKDFRDELYSHLVPTEHYYGLGAPCHREGGSAADAGLAPRQPGLPAAEARLLRIVIVSEVRFLREGLAELLGRDPSISVVGLCADLAEVVASSSPPQADLVLVDAALRDGIAAARRIRQVNPGIRIVAYAVRETKEDVIAWAEAGVIGYVADTAALSDLARLIMEIHRGEQPCSGRVAAELLHRIAVTGITGNALSRASALTRREREAAELIATGLSDKEIARRLNISLATAKLHVHNLLGKLNVQRRGQVVVHLNGHAQQPG